MANDFIRYYIGNMSLYTFEKVRKESRKFDDWVLISGTDFKYSESYGYEQIEGTHEAWIELLRKYSVIAEHRNPKEAGSSFLWHGAPLLADVLTLLSLARAQHYGVLFWERNLGNYEAGRGLWYRETSTTHVIMPISNLGQFISEALTFIEQNPSWLKDSGFNPSIYWYTQALQTCGTGPSILEMALYWVSLEIIASVYLDNNGISIKGKEQKVRRYIKDKGYTGTPWRFLPSAIKDWYKIRNNAFHEGKEPKSPLGVLSARLQQARDFTSLVLVEMLQPQANETRLQIARRIQSY